MTKYKMKTWADFKDLSEDFNYVCLTKEQFIEKIKPIVCDMCRRLFNPTEKEREETKKNLELFDDFCMEWEIVKN